MSAYTFDSPIHRCPICRRASTVKLNNMVGGLLICKYCQERLVVSWSGHYVRDPFTRQLSAARMLRRESHPVARILRDFGITKHAPFIATLGGIIFFSLFLSIVGQVPPQKLSSPTSSPIPEVSE